MDSPLKSIILLFIFGSSHSLEHSLMLSSAEENALIHAQEQAQNDTKEKAINHTSLRLDGIIYSHHNSWTIWLNGRPVKSGQKIDKLQIKKVTPEMVELIWSPNPGHSFPVCLKPTEIFQQ